MVYQFYWPSWWKLWPYYNEVVEHDLGIPIAAFVFCFGPLQVRGYRKMKG